MRALERHRRLTKKQREQAGIVGAAYLRIRYAALAGKGVTLTAEECEWITRMDDAVDSHTTVVAERLGIEDTIR